MEGMDDKSKPLLGPRVGGGMPESSIPGGEWRGRQPGHPMPAVGTTAQVASLPVVGTAFSGGGTDVRAYMADVGANYIASAKQQAFYKLYPMMDRAEIDRIVKEFPRFDEAERELRCKHLGPESTNVRGTASFHTIHAARPTLTPVSKQWLAPGKRRAQLKELKKVQPHEGKPRGEANLKRNLTLGMRTALFCVMCAMPVIIPGVKLNPNYASMVSASVSFVVFTAYKNLGITMMQAWQGLSGTLMACMYSHILNAMMPGGAGGDYYHPYLSHGANVLFVFVTLWFNISKSMTMFMLSYHCFFMMEFVNPNSKMIFNTSWAINVEAYTTTTFVTAFFGVIGAILAMTLPIPVRAALDCRQAALLSVDMLITMMDDIVEYYKRSSASLEIYRTEQQTITLHNLLLGIQADLDGSWWEGIWEGFGRWGRGQRILGLLQKHLDLMQTIGPNTKSLYISVSKEDFQETHTQCMEHISPQVDLVKNTTQDLLVAATLAAADGSIDQEEKEKLIHLIDDAKRAQITLAQDFNTVRQWLFPFAMVNSELQSESFFVYCLSIYSRFVVNYAQDMIEHQPRPHSFFQLVKANLHSMIDPQTIIHNKDHRSFTLRNTLSVMICFYLGFYCLGFSPTAAGTVSLLISQYTGSALQKNLERLQGVAIAQIFPHIITRMLGDSCWPPRIALQGFALFCWESLTNYIYYNSAQFGYIACLAGAMGAPIFVYPCVYSQDPVSAARVEKLFELASFTKLTETAIAAIVLTCVDSLLASERASSKAISHYQKALIRTVGALQAATKLRDPEGNVQGDEIENKYIGKIQFIDGQDRKQIIISTKDRNPETICWYLDTAGALNQEADKEPRYFRESWPVNLFNDLLRAMFHLRAYVKEIEHCLCGSDEKYDQILEEISKCPSYPQMEEGLAAMLDEIADLSNTVLLNEIGADQKEKVRDIIHHGVGSTIRAMPQLMNEINSCGLRYPEVITGSLEDDTVCRINVFLMIITLSAEEVTRMVHLCLEGA